jgi:hypothetical protein
MVPKLNREWHLAHKMPKNPTHEQRLEWHLAHLLNCACREPPAEIRRELEARGVVGPTVRGLK